MIDGVVAALEEALAFGDTILIVRSKAATAEVVGGGPVRRSQEWLTLGDEGAGASHVHLRIAEIRGLRFRESPDRNVALDILGPDAGAILSISFRRTNPVRVETFEAERLAAVKSRFGHIAEVPA
jgi:hypothetical protein